MTTQGARAGKHVRGQGGDEDQPEQSKQMASGHKTTLSLALASCERPACQDGGPSPHRVRRLSARGSDPTGVYTLFGHSPWLRRFAAGSASCELLAPAFGAAPNDFGWPEASRPLWGRYPGTRTVRRRPMADVLSVRSEAKAAPCCFAKSAPDEFSWTSRDDALSPGGGRALADPTQQSWVLLIGRAGAARHFGLEEK